MAFNQENDKGSKNEGGEGGDTNYGVHEGEIVVTRAGLNLSGAAGDLPSLPMRAHPGDEVFAGGVAADVVKKQLGNRVRAAPGS